MKKINREIDEQKTIEALEILQSMQKVTPEMLKAHIKTPVLSKDAKRTILEEMFNFYHSFKNIVEDTISAEFDNVNPSIANEDCFSDAYNELVAENTTKVMKEWFDQFPGMDKWYSLLLQMISTDKRYNLEISRLDRAYFLDRK